MNSATDAANGMTLAGLGNDYRGVEVVACGAADAARLVSFKR